MGEGNSFSLFTFRGGPRSSHISGGVPGPGPGGGSQVQVGGTQSQFQGGYLVSGPRGGTGLSKGKNF